MSAIAVALLGAAWHEDLLAKMSFHLLISGLHDQRMSLILKEKGYVSHHIAKELDATCLALSLSGREMIILPSVLHFFCNKTICQKRIPGKSYIGCDGVNDRRLFLVPHQNWSENEVRSQWSH